MLHLVITALLLVASLSAIAASYVVPEADVSFEAPAGFTPLSKEEISSKYPSSRAPGWVVGNRLRSTTVAYELKQDRIMPQQLPEAKLAFEQLFERIVPGLEWKDRRLVSIQGQDWIWLEMTSRAVDTDIHNIMLITSRKGRMLIFNFNSTRAEYSELESALRHSIQSISVRKD